MSWLDVQGGLSKLAGAAATVDTLSKEAQQQRVQLKASQVFCPHIVPTGRQVTKQAVIICGLIGCSCTCRSPLGMLVDDSWNLAARCVLIWQLGSSAIMLL